jgi:hypothetical protein
MLTFPLAHAISFGRQGGEPISKKVCSKFIPHNFFVRIHFVRNAAQNYFSGNICATNKRSVLQGIRVFCGET